MPSHTAGFLRRGHRKAKVFSLPFIRFQKENSTKSVITDEMRYTVWSLLLETNEGKREHLCLSMSPTQKASGV
jgi:hypothetical protein